MRVPQNRLRVVSGVPVKATPRKGTLTEAEVLHHFKERVRQTATIGGVEFARHRVDAVHIVALVKVEATKRLLLAKLIVAVQRLNVCKMDRVYKIKNSIGKLKAVIIKVQYFSKYYIFITEINNIVFKCIRNNINFAIIKMQIASSLPT